MVILILLAALAAQELPAEVKRAQKKLEGSPKDAQANLLVGAYFLEIGELGKAVAHLAEVSSVKDAVLWEAKAAEAKDGRSAEAAGDAWIDAGKKAKRQALFDRGLFWYGEAWFKKDAEEKRLLRYKLAHIFSPPADFEKKNSGGTPVGWCPFSDVQRSYLDVRFAKSGRMSIKLLPGPEISTAQSLPVRVVAGREYALTAWVFSYDTDVDGQVDLRFLDAAGKGVPGGEAVPVLSDCPFWRLVRLKCRVPDGAISVAVNVNAKFSRGAIWMDEISIRAEDGAELLGNGSFEKR